jgi:hypothetical protein
MRQGKPYLSHDDNLFPGDFVFLERLPQDTLRFSVRVCVGRVKSVDTVVVPDRDGGVCE